MATRKQRLHTLKKRLKKLATYAYRENDLNLWGPLWGCVKLVDTILAEEDVPLCPVCNHTKTYCIASDCSGKENWEK